uniref:probable protein phosphatase 2C 75 n=1 Tax=Erigeron canadensis TaxID=72917 RepID=UPI001CB95DC5|nr:probable protein phosphatase 2C 75 [Erigeron canadensis]
MTGVYGIPMEEEIDSPLKCRERRRRRIEMRRKMNSSQKVMTCEAETEIREEYDDQETIDLPEYGSMSIVGRAREMEDEISVRLNLCRPELNGGKPVHYFAVFDGHGGNHVSALCKENMHIILEEELMRVRLVAAHCNEMEELWKKAINKSFKRMDEMAMNLCQCNGPESVEVCRQHPQLSFVGSTAVVLLLTHEYIIVANCGDSRAVLCRHGKPMPLSVDHKPDREDERARIEALGGRVLFVGSGTRVEGVLAMSRAIGDRFLKQVVTSEPEYLFTKRELGDMSVILASDGLWDVLSSELTCEVVFKCQQEDNRGMVTERAVEGGGGSLCPSRSATGVAAALLVRLAMGRRSTDNISVIVVDLRN